MLDFQSFVDFLLLCGRRPVFVAIHATRRGYSAVSASAMGGVWSIAFGQSGWLRREWAAWRWESRTMQKPSCGRKRSGC